MSDCTPHAQAPATSDLVGHCAACGGQWVIRGDPDKLACPWCGVGNDYGAITLEYEGPDYGHATVRR